VLSQRVQQLELRDARMAAQFRSFGVIERP
jgi:hypothetical protein